MQFRLSWTVPWNKNCRLISSMYSRRHMKDIALKRPWVNIKARWEECVPAVLMGTLWQSCRWGFLYCMPFVASVEGNTLIDLWPSMDWEHQCLSIFEEAENRQRTTQSKRANGTLQHIGFLCILAPDFQRCAGVKQTSSMLLLHYVGHTFLKS